LCERSKPLLPVRPRRFRYPGRRPRTLIADRGYDHDEYRRLLIRTDRRDDLHQALLARASLR